MAGHLLECGTQVTGGYYAAPGLKDIPGLAHLGYPIAEIDERKLWAKHACSSMFALCIER